MDTERRKALLLKRNKERERVLVTVRLEEPSVATERNTASSSPLLDGFDDDLCFELEEVGKELDRYKEETSHSPAREKVDPSGMIQRGSASPSSNTNCSQLSTPSPPISPFPVFRHEDSINLMPLDAHLLTSLGSSEVKQTEAGEDLPKVDQAATTTTTSTTTTIRHISSPHSEKRDDEFECQMKALKSLRFSLVVKVRMLITHKKNLTLQKDLLLENFDGNKSKLIENLLENVSQSKQIDGHIQSLNKQISLTNKKIVDLKKLFAVMNDGDAEKEQQGEEPAHEQTLSQTHSKIKRFQQNKSDKVCDNSNNSLTSSKCKTPPGKRVAKTCVAEKNVQENSKGDIRNNTFHLGHESSLPKSPKRSEVEDDNPCEAMEKLSGHLAVHPTSKNTLWCNTCNLFFVNIKTYLKHLEASEHLDKVEAMGEKSLYKLFSHSTYMPDKEDRDSMQEEAFGVEFLRSAKVVFCSLCECVLLTREEAAIHTQSLQHTIKYKEYLLNNTGKELAFLKAKMGAFTEYCKRRKVTIKNNKEKEERKNKDQCQKDSARTNDNTDNQKTDLSKTKQVYVNTSHGRSTAIEGQKRTTELPAMNKRLKTVID